MIIEEKLFEIGKTYQEIIEERVKPFPSGICYHSAASLHAYFSKIYFESSVVVGDLAMLNTSDKFAVYGNMSLKRQENIGDYHAWCEIVLDDITYIIDPSIKYNKIFLKDSFKFKTSNKISDVIVSTKRETYHFKYRKNDLLIPKYESVLNTIEKGRRDINSISEELIKKHPKFY